MLGLVRFVCDSSVKEPSMLQQQVGMLPRGTSLLSLANLLDLDVAWQLEGHIHSASGWGCSSILLHCISVWPQPLLHKIQCQQPITRHILGVYGIGCSSHLPYPCHAQSCLV